MGQGNARFLGKSTHSVDAKGRVFLAKRFQQELSQNEDGRRTAVLTAGPDGALWLFDQAGFAQALENFETNPFASADERQRQLDFFEHVAEVTLDTSGRLLLPQSHRDLACIGEEVVMVGAFNRLEIWGAERWDDRHRGPTSPTPTAPREGDQ